MKRDNRLGAGLPFGLAAATWGVGFGLVVRHVLRADDYVMAEIRRHALVGALIRAQLPFLVPYLVAAAAALLLARGMRLAVGRRPGPAGWREGIAASGIYAGFIAWS